MVEYDKDKADKLRAELKALNEAKNKEREAEKVAREKVGKDAESVYAQLKKTYGAEDIRRIARRLIGQAEEDIASKTSKKK